MRCSLVKHTVDDHSSSSVCPGICLDERTDAPEAGLRMDEGFGHWRQSQKSVFPNAYHHTVSRFNDGFEINSLIVPCQTGLNKVLCLLGELLWQRGHLPSLCPNVEQGGHLIHVCQRWFSSGHLKHRTAHAPYV